MRYGGDEFLLILKDIGEADFVQKLHTIQEEIHQTRIQEYEKIRLSVSIGGVRMKEETLEEAVNRADHFMYQAKTQKNMVVTEERKLQTAGEEKVENSKMSKKSRSHRVMIVDDSEMNRFLLQGNARAGT